MKKLLISALFVVLILPLYAQETGTAEYTTETFWNQQEEGKKNEAQSEQTKKASTFSRQRFEIGFDVGAGFDNDLLNMSDILKKDIVIDLGKLGSDVRDDGFNLNLGLLGGLFVNIKNINIGSGVWDFGFFSGADGDLNFNVPKDLFTLLSKGNKKQHSFGGTISASGGIFANAGLRGSAKYEVYGKNLRVGVKPALFVPLAVIPKSGINYRLKSEDDIHLTTSGQIAVYGIAADVMEGDSVQVQTGFDISLEGEYELFSFLDVGVTLSRIPIVPASMQNGMLVTLRDFNLDIYGEDLIDGEKIDVPDFKIDTKYGAGKKNIFRPLRFDAYARYKPFETVPSFVVRPNMGFSVSINDGEGFFNIGAEAQIELLRNMFSFHVGTGLEESIWKQRLGLGFNVRAFELDLEAVFRSERFTGSFSGQGFGVNLGLRFGW